MSLDSKVTRFEVIDDSGRILTRYRTSVQLSYQDDGRTLKVFLSGKAEQREENDGNADTSVLRDQTR